MKRHARQTLRRTSALERTEANMKQYHRVLERAKTDKSEKDIEFWEKKIERAKTTIANTKAKLGLN